MPPIGVLTPIGVIPAGERQARELSRLKEPQLIREAWQEVRDLRMYRQAGYSRFEDSFQERWGFIKLRATQLIQAASVAGALGAGNNHLHTCHFFGSLRCIGLAYGNRWPAFD